MTEANSRALKHNIFIFKEIIRYVFNKEPLALPANAASREGVPDCSALAKHLLAAFFLFY